MQVGTILRHSWGYEQTNIDFYQVVSITKTGKTVTIQEIDSERTLTFSGGGTTIPKKDSFIGNPLKKRILNSGKDEVIKMRTGYARIWNGKPERFTDYY